MDEALNTLGESLKAALPGSVESASVAFGELNVVAIASKIIEVLTHLRDAPDCLFINFVDITAVDYPSRDEELEIGRLIHETAIIPATGRLRRASL